MIDSNPGLFIYFFVFTFGFCNLDIMPIQSIYGLLCLLCFGAMRCRRCGHTHTHTHTHTTVLYMYI